MRRLAIPVAALLLAACTATATEGEVQHVREQEPVVATLSPVGGAAATATPAPTATSEATPAPAATPAATAEATPVATSAASTPVGLTGIVAVGKNVYETVAGAGCAECHGPVAKGGRAKSGEAAPDIRGASETKLRSALAGGAAAMSFLELSDEEIEAVVAYLSYLNEQP